MADVLLKHKCEFKLIDSSCMARCETEPVVSILTCGFLLTALGFSSKARNKPMKFINNIPHQMNSYD